LLYLIPVAGYKLPIPATNWVCSYSNSVYLPSTELTYHTIILDTSWVYLSDTRYTGKKMGIPTRCWTRVSTTGASDQTTHRKGDDDTETSHDLLQLILRKKEEYHRTHNFALIHLLTTKWFHKKFEIVVVTIITPPPPHTQQQQLKSQQKTTNNIRHNRKTDSVDISKTFRVLSFFFFRFSFIL